MKKAMIGTLLLLVALVASTPFVDWTEAPKTVIDTTAGNSFALPPQPNGSRCLGMAQTAYDNCCNTYSQDEQWADCHSAPYDDAACTIVGKRRGEDCYALALGDDWDCLFDYTSLECVRTVT